MLKTDLDKIGNFSDADFQTLIKYVIPRKVNKNDLLLNQGQICQSVFYISSGSAYQFRYADIDENVIDLHLHGEWCLNYSSFISQLPSENIIKANSETSVYELNMHAIHHLIAVSPAFLQLGKILEGALLRMYYFQTAMSPSEKYHHRVNTRPQLYKCFARWDRDGFAMYIKKLEQGTFEWPKGKDISITSQQLTLLLQGVMLDSIRLRKRYKHVN